MSLTLRVFEGVVLLRRVDIVNDIKEYAEGPFFPLLLHESCLVSEISSSLSVRV